MLGDRNVTQPSGNRKLEYSTLKRVNLTIFPMLPLANVSY